MPRETQIRLNQNAQVQEANAQPLFTQVTSRPVDTMVSPAQSNMLRLASALDGLTPGMNAFQASHLNEVRRDAAQEAEDAKNKLIEQGRKDAMANPEARGDAALRYLNPEYKSAYFDAMSTVTSTEIDREFSASFHKNVKDPSYDVKADYDRILKEKTAGVDDGLFLQKVLTHTAPKVGAFAVQHAAIQQRLSDQKLMENATTAVNNAFDTYQNDINNPDIPQTSVTVDNMRSVITTVKEQLRKAGGDLAEIDKNVVAQLENRGLLNESTIAMLSEKDASGHAIAHSPEAQRAFTAYRNNQYKALEAASKKRRELESFHIKRDVIERPDSWNADAITAYVTSGHFTPDEGASVIKQMVAEQEKRRAEAVMLSEINGPYGSHYVATSSEHKKLHDKQLLKDSEPLVMDLTDAVRGGDEQKARDAAIRLTAKAVQHNVVNGFTTPHPVIEPMLKNAFNGAVGKDSKVLPTNFLVANRLYKSLKETNSNLLYSNFDDATRLKMDKFEAQLGSGADPVQAYANVVSLSETQKQDAADAAGNAAMRDAHADLWSRDNAANGYKPRDRAMPLGFQELVMKRAVDLKKLDPTMSDTQAVFQAHQAEIQAYFYDKDMKGMVKRIAGFNDEDTKSILTNATKNHFNGEGKLISASYDPVGDSYLITAETEDGVQQYAVSTDRLKEAVGPQELTPQAMALAKQEYDDAAKQYKDMGLEGKSGAELKDFIARFNENFRTAVDAQATEAGKENIVKQWAAMDKMNFLGLQGWVDRAVGPAGPSPFATGKLPSMPKMTLYSGLNKFLATKGIHQDFVTRHAADTFKWLANGALSATKQTAAFMSKGVVDPMDRAEYVNGNRIDLEMSRKSLDAAREKVRSDPKFNQPKIINVDDAKFAASKADKDPAFAVTSATEGFSAKPYKDNKGSAIGFGYNFDMQDKETVLRHLKEAGFANPEKTLERAKAGTLEVNREQGYQLYLAHRRDTDKLMSKVIGQETWGRLGEYHPIKIILRDFAFNMAPGPNGEGWKKFQFIKEIRNGGDVGAVLQKLYQTSVKDDKDNQRNWINRLRMWDISLQHPHAIKDLFDQATLRGGRLH